MHDEEGSVSNTLPSGVGADVSGDASTPKPEKDLAKPQTYEIIRADPNAPKVEIKRYAHHGKRRRSYTEELFRCTFITKVMADELSCGALMWRNRPQELRAHLLMHLSLETVTALSDEQILNTYIDAKRIFLEKLPDDAVHGIDEEDLDAEIDNEIESEDNEIEIGEP